MPKEERLYQQQTFVLQFSPFFMLPLFDGMRTMECKVFMYKNPDCAPDNLHPEVPNVWL